MERDELQEIAGEIARIRLQAEALKERREKLDARVVELLGPGGRQVLPDGTKVSVSKGGTALRVDAKKLKAEHPDVYEAVAKASATRPSVRVSAPRDDGHTTGEEW